MDESKKTDEIRDEIWGTTRLDAFQLGVESGAIQQTLMTARMMGCREPLIFPVHAENVTRLHVLADMIGFAFSSRIFFDGFYHIRVTKR